MPFFSNLVQTSQPYRLRLFLPLSSAQYDSSATNSSRLTNLAHASDVFPPFAIESESLWDSSALRINTREDFSCSSSHASWSWKKIWGKTGYSAAVEPSFNLRPILDARLYTFQHRPVKGSSREINEGDCSQTKSGKPFSTIHIFLFPFKYIHYEYPSQSVTDRMTG